ncbi:hypothetical protein GCM10017778_64380 [Streptomyces vinaceus]|nr:hypothetical protein GCM10017778_64380 [Streptomyces vinaceus]
MAVPFPAGGCGRGSPARALAKAASVAPSKERAPSAVRRTGSRPASAQRRTVSALTPSSPAACPMEYDDTPAPYPRRGGRLPTGGGPGAAVAAVAAVAQRATAPAPALARAAAA